MGPQGEKLRPRENPGKWNVHKIPKTCESRNHDYPALKSQFFRMDRADLRREVRELLDELRGGDSCTAPSLLIFKLRALQQAVDCAQLNDLCSPQSCLSSPSGPGVLNWHGIYHSADVHAVHNAKLVQLRAQLGSQLVIGAKFLLEPHQFGWPALANAGQGLHTTPALLVTRTIHEVEMLRSRVPAGVVLNLAVLIFDVTPLRSACVCTLYLLTCLLAC